jgi:CheY-like chemotaxis protein
MSFDTDRRENVVGFRTRIRRDFFDQIPAISGSVRDLCAEFMKAEGSAAQSRALDAIARKIGFLTHMTGMAGCHRISQLCSALEALLFELREKPDLINESTRHTVSSTCGLLVDFLERADDADVQSLSPTRVLLVDDDAVSNRALIFALGRTHLKTSSVTDPLKALLKLKQSPYDVVLLDINLPNMDGITLRTRMRELPLHQDTPVIFLTSYAEFAERARAMLTANDDLIAKPVIPIELAVKVTAHVLKRRLPAAKS